MKLKFSVLARTAWPQPSPALCLQARAGEPGSYANSRDLNSGPDACAAGTHPTEPSLQLPRYCVEQRCLKVDSIEKIGELKMKQNVGPIHINKTNGKFSLRGKYGFSIGSCLH